MAYDKNQGDRQAMNWIAGFGPAQFVATLAKIIMGWFTVTPELFLHKPGTLGERYITWLRLWFAYGVVWLFAYPIAFIGNEGNPSWIFIGIYLGFIVMSLWHRLAIFQRNRAGVRWHSMSQGTSHLATVFPSLDYSMIHNWIEPLLWIALCIPFFWLDKVVFTWVLTSGILMLIKRRQEYYHERGFLLDMIDSSIEAEFLKEVIVEGADAEDADGWRVIGISTKNSTKEQRKALARSMERADPIRQREDLAGEIGDAISARTLKVINASPSTENEPAPAKVPVETQDNGSNPVGKQESG